MVNQNANYLLGLSHIAIRTLANLALQVWPHDPICKLCHIHPKTVTMFAMIVPSPRV
jgi:hypothetical protein